ncbi:hypothetical protein CRX72_17885 [Pantoea sp. BRM17]|nr:hypothetical protein CRX72_17885 [Pantoea sp. BRM17]
MALPGVASSDTPSTNVGRFFETQSSTGKRYTVKQSDGRSVQEVNAITAAQMQPFDTITFSDHFGRAAQKKGAASFFIVRQVDANNGGNQYVTAYVYKADAKARIVQDTSNSIPADSEAGKAALAAGGAAAGNGGNWRVTADLYKADAAKASTDTQYRVINGVKELPKAEAYRLEPFDTVSVSGFFSSQPAVNDAISLLSLLAANAFAAKELTPEQAAGLKPFERININGRFNAIGDATSAVSRAADEKGADSFYVQGINDTKRKNIAAKRDMHPYGIHAKLAETG